MQESGGRTHTVQHQAEARKSSMHMCVKLETALKTPADILKQASRQCGEQAALVRYARMSGPEIRLSSLRVKLLKFEKCVWEQELHHK